jgi:autotransporter-associated beta strand protein
MNIMKTTPHNKPFVGLTKLAVAAVLAVAALPSAFAASQTWTNAPVSTSWTNVLNWVAKAVPGAVNGTGNGANADTATFNSPIVGGFGSAANPIAPDDATTAGNRSRAVLGVTFDTTNCGAYYFASPSPAVLPATGVPATGILYVGHNGALRINAPVTNSQTFLIPMYVLLPSSTAGIFNLVNNSTNPNAALYVSQITHGGATTRATTFILDGTNTANNVVTNLSEGGGNATGGFTKQGSSKWTIAGPGTFPAASSLNINDGTLTILDAGAFGLANTATVNSNAQLRIDGSITPTTATFTVQRNGTVKVNGSSTVNGITVGTAVSGTSPTLATTSSSDVMTVGSTGNKVTGGALDSLIHISGPGTVSLPFDNNYLGKWTVDAGTLSVNSGNSLSTGANLNIAAGATFDTTAIGAGTYTLSTAALSASGTGTSTATAATIKADAGGTIDLATGSKGISLTFTPTAFTGDTTHPSLYISQGTLSLAGNAFSINNASGAALGVGTYRLILQASGSITSGGGYSVTGVTGSGLTAGNVASIVVTGSEVDLVVSPYVAKNLVWSGTGSAWDIATTSDWLNGVTASIFNNSDNVTFNATGSANPSVTLASTLAPGSVTVDTSANNYTLNGGQIAGGASLLKKSSGTLFLNQANTYGGGTVVSNGVLKIGINNAVSATGAGDVKIVTPATLDLNGFNNIVNGLNGDGTVDITSGGVSTLTVGENGNNGAFTGTIKNTSGTLSLTKDGVGTETLSGSNPYTGATVINAGSLRGTSANSIGAGASAVTVNVGAVLDVGANNLAISTISGVGTIANNTSAATNTVIINGTSTFSGTIADGSGGGGVTVLVPAGANLRLNVANSYSGGSIVGAGGVLQIGNVGSMGSGGIVASNGAVVGMSNANNPSAGMGNTITTVDNAAILFTGGGNQANNFFGQFVGASTATNVLTNAFSMGGASSFAGFNGTVIVGPSASVRWFNAAGGGDAATFDFKGGNVFSRDASTIRMGALQGGSPTSGIGNPSVTPSATYIIGAKNLSTTFSGGIGTSNNIVKTGTGVQVFDGMSITTNTDNATYTNYLYAPIVNYWGSTTISNGTLALIAPNSLTNSSSITLAGAGAVLDASKMGYASNYVEPAFSQNVSDIITNGTLNLAAVVPMTGVGQTLSGIGSITGALVADTGTTVSPGLPTGSLTVSSNITLNAINMNVTLNRTNSPNCGQLAAAGVSTITVNGGTLTITNAGNDLVTGDVFHIFNKASIGNFTVTNLPASNALNTISYVFTNKLAIDGTLVVLQGAPAVNLTPTNITTSVSGNILTVSWPADHIGWRLQSQTNPLSTGLNPAAWTEVVGSASVNTLNFTLDPASGAVFYRMVYP